MEKELFIKKMNITIRKLAFLFIWWGAFTFYAGIVVPVGMKVLGSHIEMGFITQEVTNYLNFISLPIFLYVCYIFRAEKLQFRLGILLIMLQIILFVLHDKLFNLLEFQLFTVKSKSVFYSLHRIYLLLSTFIWLIVSGIIFVEVKKN